MMKNITDTILVFEDDQVFSGFLKSCLRQVYPSHNVIVFNHPSGGLNSDILSARVRLVFYDLYYFNENGISFISKILNKFYNSELIAITSSNAYGDLTRCLEAGVKGYIVKGFNQDKIMESLYAVQNGDPVVSPEMLRKLMDQMSMREKNKFFSDVLLPVEQETLSILSLGKSYQSTADILGITIDGLRSRIRKIYKKLEVKNRIGAIEAYRNMNYKNH